MTFLFDLDGTLLYKSSSLPTIKQLANVDGDQDGILDGVGLRVVGVVRDGDVALCRGHGRGGVGQEFGVK